MFVLSKFDRFKFIPPITQGHSYANLLRPTQKFPTSNAHSEYVGFRFFVSFLELFTDVFDVFGWHWVTRIPNLKLSKSYRNKLRKKTKPRFVNQRSNRVPS